MLVRLDHEGFEQKFGWYKDYKPLHGESSVYWILASLIKKYNPDFILEFGTSQGAGTIVLAHYSNSFCKIFTIDITKEMGLSLNSPQAEETQMLPVVGCLIDQFNLRHKVIQLICDSKQLEWGMLPSCDIAFIDGNHTYDYVKYDTELAFSSSDIIVWHDYQLPDVKKAVDEFIQEEKKDCYLIDVPSIDDTKTVIYVSYNDANEKSV